MSRSLDRVPAPTPRKMSADSIRLRGEGDRKPLAERDEARLIGRVIERALVLADITKQDAAFRLGYADQSAVSRWIAGIETPQLARLWTLGRRFRQCFLISLADACADESVEVSSIIKIARTA